MEGNLQDVDPFILFYLLVGDRLFGGMLSISAHVIGFFCLTFDWWRITTPICPVIHEWLINVRLFHRTASRLISLTNESHGAHARDKSV